MSEIRIPIRGGFVLVDERDVPKIAERRWYTRRAKCGVSYAVSTHRTSEGRNRVIYMHRLLCGLHLPGASHVFVDHINGDGLDNRRTNLRPCTPRENSTNKIGYITRRSRSLPVGVQLERHKFIARIGVGRNRVYLGSYDTAEAADRARRVAERAIHGEFSPHPRKEAKR